MKCPKCGYLGFERVDRCRNCGYEFALTPEVPAQELTLQARSPDGEGPGDEVISFQREPDLPRSGTTPDLPLFGASAVEDQPLITKPSPPRQPLAVRRATPETPKVRPETRSQTFDLTFDVDPAAPAPPLVRRAQRSTYAALDASRGHAAEAATDTAGLAARFVAMAIDVLILAAVDTLIVYLTIEFCGISLRDVAMLPKTPLLAFLFIQNSGYLIAFTVGGQTLGKMAVGIKIVAADEAEPLDLGRSVRRTLLWCILAIPAGLGFLTALLAPDHRGLHDRLAGTRVVRASA